ncbi:hypothetical protein G5I_12958 [Acromyrmex echinatior]|uniref:Uncharacterized protein n=1 Tax=Acromyrmex echinatior TaxID=103372 RepID=F4X3P8_ACREC|nr:hypothetical protein G5I_12958 [Acromyrmex echinatior]
MNGYDAIMQGRHGLCNTTQPSDTENTDYYRRRRHARWGHANVDLEDGDGEEVDGGEKFLAGPGGGGGINFPSVVMLIDTSTRGSIAVVYTKGCAEQTRSVPRPFNALVSDVTALELPSILQCYALTKKVATDRIYGVS